MNENRSADYAYANPVKNPHPEDVALICPWKRVIP